MHDSYVYGKHNWDAIIHKNVYKICIKRETFAVDLMSVFPDEVRNMQIDGTDF